MSSEDTVTKSPDGLGWKIPVILIVGLVGLVFAVVVTLRSQASHTNAPFENDFSTLSAQQSSTTTTPVRNTGTKPTTSSDPVKSTTLTQSPSQRSMCPPYIINFSATQVSIGQDYHDLGPDLNPSLRIIMIAHGETVNYIGKTDMLGDTAMPLHPGEIITVDVQSATRAQPTLECQKTWVAPALPAIHDGMPGADLSPEPSLVMPGAQVVVHYDGKLGCKATGLDNKGNIRYEGTVRDGWEFSFRSTDRSLNSVGMHIVQAPERDGYTPTCWVDASAAGYEPFGLQDMQSGWAMYGFLELAGYPNPAMAGGK